MEPKNIVLATVEAVIWYLFLWYSLSTIKHPDRSLWLASLILLVLGYLGFVTCPWIRETQAWNHL